MKKRLAISLFFLATAAHADEPITDSYGTSPGSLIRRARGHDGDKTVLASGDVLNGVYGRGYTGTAFTTANNAAIELQTSQAWTPSANGTKVIVKTTQTGGTSQAAVLTITNNGLTLLSDAAPRTNLTPPAVGTLVWNSADGQLCVSTGTAVNSWVQVADGTTACSH